MIRTLLLFKKTLHVFAFMVLIVVLTLAVPPNKSDDSYLQKNQSSITELKKHSYSFAIFVSINQASNFNHWNQTSVDYIFVVLLALFLVSAVNYQWYKPLIVLPPWYMVLKQRSRIFISGLKFSNLQFKIQLTCPN